MRGFVGRCRCVVAAICVAVSPLPAWAQIALPEQIEAMVTEPAVARAHWGVMVAGLDGAPIYALNAGQLFQPASNAKLFTTAAAVHLLGEHRRFTTVLEGPPGSGGATTGNTSRASTLHGDLILHGSGDANLSGRTVPYVEPVDRPKGPVPVVDPLRYLAEMADRIAAAGVTHVTGDIVGDDTLFPSQPYASDWAVDDLVWGYGAPVSALTIADNQLELTSTPAAAAGVNGTTVLNPSLAYYTLDASIETVARKTPASVFVERAPGSRILKVSGALAVDAGSDVEQVAIQDPAVYAAIALKGLLEARGITVDGIARAQHRLPVESAGFQREAREPLPDLPKAAFGPVSTILTGRSTCMDACPLWIEHTSPTLIEDVVVTNKVSQNLHAELMLRQLGKAFGTDGSFAQGVRVVRQFVINAGIDPDDVVFYDGSGLSGHDLVTPRAVVKLLQYAAIQ